MLQAGTAESGEGVNHPLAKRMAVIAFINQNLAVAAIFGSFSVLLSGVETRLHIGPQLSTLAIPALTLATAFIGPTIGILASRIPLKRLMLTGSIACVLGFLLLAFTTSYPLYLIAFGFLLGPAMSTGTVLPSALVTRWFVVNRGKALGFVCVPIVIPFVPPAATWVLAHYGLPTTYLLLAALTSISVLANLFIVERPPESVAVVAPEPDAAPVAPSKGYSLSIGELLRMPRFWARTFGFAISTGATVLLTAQLVQIGRTWAFTDPQSATLLSLMSVAGIVGTLLFGWVSDRLGGMPTLALLMIDDAVIWLLLSFHPGFAATAVLIFLFGVHSAGNMPAYAMALSEGFGRESFARSFGIANLINLPFTVLAVPAGAMIYTRTHSYGDALLGVAALFLVTFFLILLTRRDPVARSA